MALYLGVDYDGTRSSSSESSVNYSIQEYVNDCVYTFVDAANKSNIEDILPLAHLSSIPCFHAHVYVPYADQS